MRDSLMKINPDSVYVLFGTFWLMVASLINFCYLMDADLSHLYKTAKFTD